MKIRVWAGLFSLALVGLGSQVPAQVLGSSAKNSPQTVRSAPKSRVDDEKAIQSLLEKFVLSFNAGNAKATAATYTESALVIDEDGKRTEGRAAIEQQYTEAFADYPGSKIAIRVEALKFVGAETAIEQGRSTITPAKGAGAGIPEITRFTAIYVKEGGEWRQAVVRDEPDQDLTPGERLKELEWLVGDWVNESDDAIVSTSCKWDKGGNFLIRDFTMKVQGRPVLSGTQRIGWDPLKKQFKTWVFDTEGGHGEGYFTQIGNQWVVKVDGVNESGKPVTATNIITRQGKDRIGWESSARTVGGSAVPGSSSFVIVRKPPEAHK